jgi:hypothetical protein
MASCILAFLWGGVLVGSWWLGINYCSQGVIVIPIVLSIFSIIAAFIYLLNRSWA